MDDRNNDMVKGERGSQNQEAGGTTEGTGSGWDAGTQGNQSAETKTSAAIPPTGTTDTDLDKDDE